MSCRRGGSVACGGVGGKVGMSSKEPLFWTMRRQVENAHGRGAGRGWKGTDACSMRNGPDGREDMAMALSLG